MGNKTPKPAAQEEPPPKCRGEFHLQADFEIECHNRHCRHGPNGGKIVLCPACGNNQGRGRWLCRMCYLAEMHNNLDDDMEIDTTVTNNFSRAGIRLN